MADVGNTPSTAGTITLNTSKIDSIEIAGDTDWFGITLTKGVTYQFDLEGAATGQGTLSDPFMRLRNNVGVSVVFDNEFGEGSNAQIIYYATSGGPYYISVGSAVSGGTGTYKLSTASLGASWSRLVTIPENVNLGATDPSNLFIESILGTPGPGLTATPGPESLASRQVKDLLTTEDVDPSAHNITVTGIRPAVDSLLQIFANVNRDLPDLMSHISTEGMLAVRYISGTTTISNHSWGIAVDLVIDGVPDRPSTADDHTQAGIAALIPYFHAAGWVAGAGWTISQNQDAEHFEVSQETLQLWSSQGLLRPLDYYPVSDFNGDGKSDILLYTAGGLVADLTMAGSQIVNADLLTYQGTAIGIPSGLSLAGIGNFNGDHCADLLLRSIDGTFFDWTMNGPQIGAAQVVTFQGGGVSLDFSWSVVAVGDFNADRHSDILLRSSGGVLVDWTMDGPQIAAAQIITFHGDAISLNSSWNIVGIGDFNADHHSDILLRSTDGTFVVWTMNGSQIAAAEVLQFGGAPLTSLPLQWAMEGVGDFNGDGAADILLRNVDGRMVDWTMNGANITFAELLTYQGNQISLDASWEVLGLGDLNGDHNADVLLRNSDGGLVDWTMSGAHVSTAEYLSYQDSAITSGLDSSVRIAHGPTVGS